MSKNNLTIFNSPTLGTLQFPQVLEKIEAFIKDEPTKTYSLIVGTDSEAVDNGEKGADFVTAVIIHRRGHGGIYFWRRIHEFKIVGLRNRIYREAVLSLELAQEVLDWVKDSQRENFEKDGENLDLEIHVDIGKKGPTREMIAEVVGMIRGSGFAVKTKPEAFGASKVADRYT